MSQPRPSSASAFRCFVQPTSHPLPASPSRSSKAVSNSVRTGRHNAIDWEVARDLLRDVEEYGLGSAQVLQTLRVLNSGLLFPSDIRYIAKVLFKPVLFDIFLKYWREAAERAAAGNRLLPQRDPRFQAGVDILLGAQASSSPNFEATWDSAVLEQSQRAGFRALLRTIELASPGPAFAAITQGEDERFLPFVRKFADALEKQIEDDALREKLCKQLAQCNANSQCKRIIAALPGSPSLVDMVNACAWVGSVGHTVPALMAPSQPGQIPLGGGQQKSKIKSKGKQGTCNPTWPGTSFLCTRCLRPGHFAEQCKAKFHANGQPLADPGTGQ
ncbi:endogenous retrovirus group K member 9 Gag polyprotein-like [Camarhynchus parvulus]|uniref:endogenous retrovirus group K member 9 Gag polyprotein-like n=1 Tax=Geospiza parvula TaxID=87175 RepID=UPI001237FF85|nr:endogenous retrovirus group K member 9 Gag polyprotein-like [Camarhynchus parvulus]